MTSLMKSHIINIVIHLLILAGAGTQEAQLQQSPPPKHHNIINNNQPRQNTYQNHQQENGIEKSTIIPPAPPKQRSRKLCTPCDPATFFQHQNHHEHNQQHHPQQQHQQHHHQQQRHHHKQRATADVFPANDDDQRINEVPVNDERTTTFTLPTMSTTAFIANGESDGDSGMATCKIRVAKTEKVIGKCVTLKGGIIGCQSDRYLDPANEDCWN